MRSIADEIDYLNYLQKNFHPDSTISEIVDREVARFTHVLKDGKIRKRDKDYGNQNRNTASIPSRGEEVGKVEQRMSGSTKVGWGKMSRNPNSDRTPPGFVGGEPILPPE